MSNIVVDDNESNITEQPLSVTKQYHHFFSLNFFFGLNFCIFLTHPLVIPFFFPSFFKIRDEVQIHFLTSTKIKISVANHPQLVHVNIKFMIIN